MQTAVLNCAHTLVHLLPHGKKAQAATMAAVLTKAVESGSVDGLENVKVELSGLDIREVRGTLKARRAPPGK